MPLWLNIATGPFFRFTFVVLILGLARLVIITIWDMISTLRKAGDRRLPFAQLVNDSLSWLFPIFRIHRSKRGYSYASFSFHLGIIFASLFLRNHLDILQSNIGFSWPAFARPLLDILTLITIFTGLYLMLYRLYIRTSRALSSLTDYIILFLLLTIFISGYLAGRVWNPIPYDLLMLLHTVSGFVILLLIPFTKMAHCVLFPLMRFGSEIVWHLTPHGGSDVVKTLHGSEGRKL